MRLVTNPQVWPVRWTRSRLMEPMPVYGGLSAILFFASMGLPGLCGFVGEVMVMLSAWNYSPGLAVPAILTTILTAGYLLWTWQRVYLGTNPATTRCHFARRSTSTRSSVSIVILVERLGRLAKGRMREVCTALALAVVCSD